jgi:hypothetical protein
MELATMHYPEDCNEAFDTLRQEQIDGTAGRTMQPY